MKARLAVYGSIDYGGLQHRRRLWSGSRNSVFV